MLKLARRAGEALIIETSQGTIRILFEGFNGKQMKIGIAAPKSVNVIREEVLLRQNH